MNGRIAVLISGSGSNLQALLDACNDGVIPGRIIRVISNRDDAFGLERARRAGVSTSTIRHTDHSDRAAFDAAVAERLDADGTDLVVLAGFMRILTSGFVSHYTGRMINIHPSLLPDYRGLNTHERALSDGVQRHGCTVHFVVPELDAGPAVVQGTVPVYPDDTPQQLQQRVHAQEHRVYPLAVRWFVQGRLALDGEHATLDGVPLHSPLRIAPEDPLPE